MELIKLDKFSRFKSNDMLFILESYYYESATFYGKI